jgi:hypothetical protein
MQFQVNTPSAEMANGYVDTLLNFQIFLVSRVKFSYFVIFSVSVLESLGQRLIISIKSDVYY